MDAHPTGVPVRAFFLSAMQPEILEVLDALERLATYRSFPADVSRELVAALGHVNAARYALDAELEGVES